MADPIRIRAKLQSGVAEVHVLMPHPMETGMRKDEAGRLIEAHYITDVRVAVAGRPALAARMGLAVSQDPLLTFRCRGARAGDRVSVSWIDNRGDQRSDEVLIV